MGGLMTKNQFKKAVQRLIGAWKAKYTKEAQDSDYSSLDVWHDNDWTKGQIEEAGQEVLQSQIDYIAEMVSFQLWFGMAPIQSNLAIIRKFLDMQVENPRKNNKPAYAITFHGGCSEHSVHAYVQELGDVDFSDSYDFLNFDIIEVYRLGRKRWTEKSIKGTIKQIKDDFEFDGSYPKIKVEGKMKDVVRKNASLNLVCRME